MKWLFLFFVIDVSVGEMKPRVMIWRAFDSEAACQALGEQFKVEYVDNSLKSFSICVPESAFDTYELGTQRLDR